MDYVANISRRHNVGFVGHRSEDIVLAVCTTCFENIPMNWDGTTPIIELMQRWQSLDHSCVSD
jgi:hypothetical protein